MNDTFDVVNSIFDSFVDDPVLPALIGIDDVTDILLCDTKFRRSFADSTLLTTDELNFIDFSFIPSSSATSNYLVNKETLEFNIYTANIAQASVIYKEVHRILKAQYGDTHCTSPCQAGCPIQGIVRYSFRARPLVGS